MTENNFEFEYSFNNQFLEGSESMINESRVSTKSIGILLSTLVGLAGAALYLYWPRGDRNDESEDARGSGGLELELTPEELVDGRRLTQDDGKIPDPIELAFGIHAANIDSPPSRTNLATPSGHPEAMFEDDSPRGGSSFVWISSGRDRADTMDDIDEDRPSFSFEETPAFGPTKPGEGQEPSKYEL